MNKKDLLMMLNAKLDALCGEYRDSVNGKKQYKNGGTTRSARSQLKKRILILTLIHELAFNCKDGTVIDNVDSLEALSRLLED